MWALENFLLAPFNLRVILHSDVDIQDPIYLTVLIVAAKFTNIEQ
jgi:hypothetical protein